MLTCLLSPTTMAMIKDTVRVGENVEKSEPPYLARGHVNCSAALGIV